MVDLGKVQRYAPGLVDLTKRAGVSIEKAGLAGHRASVVLVLDVSGSTRDLYRSGAMQAVADQAFVMALNFDDDGEVPVCLFESRAHDRGTLTLENHHGFIDRARRGLNGGTCYSAALRWCRVAAMPDGKGRGARALHHQMALPAPQPTYVLFVTDGNPTDDRNAIKAQLIEASYEPVFFQFIGVGGERFAFLEALDTMAGRLIDNANFFAVPDPRSFTDEQMFGALLAEYPSWVRLARSHRLIW
jgi:hypothetical protein